jgi:hypothetical protein
VKTNNESTVVLIMEVFKDLKNVRANSREICSSEFNFQPKNRYRIKSYISLSVKLQSLRYCAYPV